VNLLLSSQLLARCRTDWKAAGDCSRRSGSLQRRQALLRTFVRRYILDREHTEG